MPTGIFQLVRALVWLAIGLAIFFGGRALLTGTIDFIQAPVAEQRDAARGNLAASKAATDAQNKGVDGLAAAGKARAAKSEAAVKSAGESSYARAKAIQDAPAVGATDYERMVNRIDTELGLK